MSDNTYQLYQHRLITKRKQQGLSLQALAERSGVSKSIVYKIEQAQVQPSIQTASRIAVGLGCSLSEMFQEETKTVLFHPVDQQFVLDNGGHVKKKVSPSTDSMIIDIFHEQLKQGESINQNSDLAKFIVSLDDALHIKANDTEYVLKKGDCLYLESKVDHTITNKTDSPVHFSTTTHSKKRLND